MLQVNVLTCLRGGHALLTALQSVPMGVFVFAYQRYAAQQNDEVDDELEEFVLDDDETGLPAVEATPPGSLRRVHVQGRTATVTV